MGVIGLMGLIFYRVCVLTCYRAYVLTASRPFDASTGSATTGSATTGSGTLYGVRLLVLAAEWSPQAFLGG